MVKLTWKGIVTPYTVSLRLPNGGLAFGSGGSFIMLKMNGMNSSRADIMMETPACVVYRSGEEASVRMFS